MWKPVDKWQHRGGSDPYLIEVEGQRIVLSDAEGTFAVELPEGYRICHSGHAVESNNLQEVFDRLVEELYHWNGVVEDEDRGRSNDGLVIALWDDGSGRVANHWGKDDIGHDVLNVQCEFDNVEQLVEWLSEYIGL